MTRSPFARAGLAALAAALLYTAALVPAFGAEFSVTPIRIELKPATMNETITVINHADARLRVSMKLMEWSQDAAGNDVYKDSADLIYFPRQMEVPADSKRLVRVGLKTPAAVQERSYRLFIEEEPEPSSAPAAGRAQVALLFRFGVPIFVPPAVPRTQFEAAEPVLQKGKLSLQVRNSGNHHVRVNRLVITDGAGHSQEVPGWYSLAGTERRYTADIPPDICRKARSLAIAVEGEGVRLDRKLDVDPASCG